MMHYYLPVAIIVGSNVFYHILAKSIPQTINPLISLVVTYLVGAVIGLTLFFLTDPVKDLTMQFKQVNWVPVVFALAIIGLEFGNIMMYRTGWNISVGALVCSITLAVILVFVGLLVYKEHISFYQIIGIGLCIAGLLFINSEQLLKFLAKG